MLFPEILICPSKITLALSVIDRDIQLHFNTDAMEQHYLYILNCILGTNDMYSDNEFGDRLTEEEIENADIDNYISLLNEIRESINKYIQQELNGIISENDVYKKRKELHYNLENELNTRLKHIVNLLNSLKSSCREDAIINRDIDRLLDNILREFFKSNINITNLDDIIEQLQYTKSYILKLNLLGVQEIKLCVKTYIIGNKKNIEKIFSFEPRVLTKNTVLKINPDMLYKIDICNTIFNFAEYDGDSYVDLTALKKKDIEYIKYLLSCYDNMDTIEYFISIGSIKVDFAELIKLIEEDNNIEHIIALLNSMQRQFKNKDKNIIDRLRQIEKDVVHIKSQETELSKFDAVNLNNSHLLDDYFSVYIGEFSIKEINDKSGELIHCKHKVRCDILHLMNDITGANIEIREDGIYI